MAIAVVNKAQTGNVQTATLGVAATPTAGNLLIVFASQTGSAVAMKGKDNASGETGWSNLESGGEPLKTLTSSSSASVFVLIKTATGSEATLEPVIGTGGTVQGLCYFELSGATATLDGTPIVHSQVATNTIDSATISTTDAGDVILAALAYGAQNPGNMKEKAPMKPITTASASKIPGLSYVPGEVLTSKTLEAEWTTTKPFGSIWLALKPAAAVTTGATMLM